MLLFDEIERTDSSHRKPNESVFAYLNRSASLVAAEARIRLESWYSHFSHSPHDNFMGRLRNKDDYAYSGAVFELLVHESLRRMGFAIEINPSIGNQQPDYLINDGKRHCYVECTMLNSGVASTNPHMEDAIGKLKGLCPPDFDVVFTVIEGELDTPLSRRELARRINNMPGLDNPDMIQKCIDADGYEAVPSMIIEKGSWIASIQFHPAHPNDRGANNYGAVSVVPYRMGTVDDATAIQRTIEAKANKYKTLEAPLIVAVNTQYPVSDADVDEVDALFGRREGRVIGDSVVEARSPGGVWLYENRASIIPRYTRLRAVWMFRNTIPRNLHRTSTRLYVSPWADKDELPTQLYRLPRVIAIPEEENGEIQAIRYEPLDGNDIAQLLT